jgi:hypothetical protein
MSTMGALPRRHTAFVDGARGSEVAQQCAWTKQALTDLKEAPHDEAWCR